MLAIRAFLNLSCAKIGKNTVRFPNNVANCATDRHVGWPALNQTSTVFGAHLASFGIDE